MKPLSVTDLAELTGHTWRTCARRLREAGISPAEHGGKSAKLFDSERALLAIYAPRIAAEGLDPMQERARRDAAMADSAEMANAARRGELAELSHVEVAWGQCIGNARAVLLQLPTRAAALVSMQEHRPIVLAETRRAVHEALTELASFQPTNSTN